MKEWIFRTLILCVVGVAGYSTFSLYQKGLFDIPDMPEGAYAFSRGSFRGIVFDQEVSNPRGVERSKFGRQLVYVNPERRYLSVPYEVPSWLEDAWSICTRPADNESAALEQSMPDSLKRNLVGARLDAVCRISVEGEEVLTGLLYSVPKL